MEFLINWGPLIIALLALIVSIVVPICIHSAGKRERVEEKLGKLREDLAKVEERTRASPVIRPKMVAQKANKQFEKSIEDTSDYMKLGNTAFSKDNYEKAIEYFDKVIELNPDNAEAWCYKSIALHGLYLNEEALKAINKTIELEPDNAVGWELKGDVLRRLGRDEEALKAADKAIELEPNDADAWHLKGSVLRKLGRREEADRAIEKAKELGYKE